MTNDELKKAVEIADIKHNHPFLNVDGERVGSNIFIQAARELLELRELLGPLVEARDKATKGGWLSQTNSRTVYDEDMHDLIEATCCCNNGRFKGQKDADFVCIAANILSQPALRRLLGEGG